MSPMKIMKLRAEWRDLLPRIILLITLVILIIRFGSIEYLYSVFSISWFSFFLSFVVLIYPEHKILNSFLMASIITMGYLVIKAGYYNIFDAFHFVSFALGVYLLVFRKPLALKYLLGFVIIFTIWCFLNLELVLCFAVELLIVGPFFLVQKYRKKKWSTIIIALYDLAPLE